MSDMKVLMENWRGYQEEIITEDTWGELKKVLDTVLLAKKGSEVAGIASRLLGGNAIVDFIRAAGGIKGLIKNVGKLPDQKTDKFPFLDMFNVDDEYSKLIDDRVENTLLNRLSDLISKQSPNEQIPAGWNINDWLENELKTIFNDRTVAGSAGTARSAGDLNLGTAAAAIGKSGIVKKATMRSLGQELSENIDLSEKVFADYEAPKNKWVDIPTGDFEYDPKNVDLTDEIYGLIDTAYSKIGGHFDFKKASDVPADHDEWIATDVDDDPDPDAVRFGKKTPHGVKLTGSGHDGSKSAKTAYLEKTAELLYEPGYYAEMSKAIAHIMITRYGVPFVGDPETVQKVLGSNKPINWLGDHPEEKYSEYNGWYTRSVSGRKDELKIMLGNPNV